MKTGDPIRNFVRESNQIEGIVRPPTLAEVEALRSFLALPAVRVGDLENFVNVWALFGCGSVAMNIALLAIHHGLGTCLEVAPVAYPDVIRGILEIPDSKLMVIAIAIGYPDWDNPVNRFRSEREPLDRIVKWYGMK